MKIAVCQYSPSESLSKNLSYACNAIEESANSGANLIVFGEWFLGIIPPENPDKIFQTIARKCRSRNINAITGNIPCKDRSGLIEQKIVKIDQSGKIISTQKRINPYHMEIENISSGNIILETQIPLGTAVALNGLDAIDPVILKKLSETKINFIILQINPSSLLEVESLKELAIALSISCSDIVIVPVQGTIRQKMSGAFIAYEGAILEEGTGKSDIIVADLTLKSFINFKSLRKQLVIPGLLKQKYESELGAWQNPA